MDHNHSMTTHALTCPMEDCDYRMEIHAHDNDEAVIKFMQAGKAHMIESHADSEDMSMGSLEQMVRDNMREK